MTNDVKQALSFSNCLYKSMYPSYTYVGNLSTLNNDMTMANPTKAGWVIVRISNPRLTGRDWGT